MNGNIGLPCNVKRINVRKVIFALIQRTSGLAPSSSNFHLSAASYILIRTISWTCRAGRVEFLKING